MRSGRLPFTVKAKPQRRHALRSPTPYGLMASGPRVDQGIALMNAVSDHTFGSRSR